jgi:predicted TIM-barrel fold metal-dependent hydrolase
VTPVFHVADQPRVLDDAFYTDPADAFVPTFESIFLWVPAAVAVTDLIINGVFDRYPALRIGIVELSSIWVPQYLLMLDGGWDFTSTLNGQSPTELKLRPSQYFQRQVRVSSFSYEQPTRLTAKAGDLFMSCSDYPHSEGTASPIEDYARGGSSPDDAPGFFHDNVAALLGN